MSLFPRGSRLAACLLSLLMAPGWTRPTDLLSPRGLAAAYVVVESTPLIPDGFFLTHGRDERPETATSHLYVCEPDGRRSREIATLSERADAHVTWLDDARLAVWCNTSHHFAVFTANGEALAPIPLAQGVEVGEFEFSPDGTRVLIGGSITYALDDRHDGLLLYDLFRRELRLLWEGPKNGPAAWSPDGRTVALAVRCPGQKYRLALIDVADATFVQTSQQGHNPAWSPDGRRIAYSGAHRPFSYAYNGPIAPRVGVLDVRDRMRAFASPLFTANSDPGGFAWSTAVDPHWSPDGRRIAYLRFGPKGPDRRARSQRELWVASADGRQSGRVAGGVERFAWAPDGGALVVLIDGRVQSFPLAQPAAVVADLSPASVEFAPPVSLQYERKPEGAYDAAAVLQHNRAWLTQDATAPESLAYLLRRGGEERTTWAEGIGLLVETRGKDYRGNWQGWKTAWTEPDFSASYRVADDGLAAFNEDKPAQELAGRIAERRRGLPFRCAAMAWASATDACVLRRVEGRPLENRVVLHLVPKRKPFRVETPFLGEDVKRFELHLDTSSLCIVKEVDYGDGETPAVVLDFSQFSETGKGVVPARIAATKGGQPAGELSTAWLPAGAWMIVSSSSEGRHADLRTVVELKAPLDERARTALKLRGAEIRALLGGAPPDRSIPLETCAYTFGKYYPIEGGGRVFFTLGRRNDIVLRVAPAAGAGGTLVCALLGEGAGLPLCANQADLAPDGATIEFSRSLWSRDIRSFHLSLSGRRVALATASAIREVPAWSFSPGLHRIQMPAEHGGAPVAGNVELAADASGRRAVVRSYSPSGSLMEDDLVTVVLFNAANRAACAGRGWAPFARSTGHSDSASMELPLPGSADFGDCAAWTLGGRAGSQSVYISFRVQFMDDGEPRVSLEELLEADVPELRKLGVTCLQRAYLGHFNDRHAREPQPAWKGSPEHRDRLLSAFSRSDDPAVLGGCILLLGPMGEPADTERFRRYLTHDDDFVKDAAAVGLALLGDAAGLDRLAAITERKRPEQKPSWEPDDWSGAHLLAEECTLALSRVSSAEAIDLLGKQLLQAIEDAGGRTRHDEGLARKARHLAAGGQPEAGPWLRKLLDATDKDRGLDDAVAQGLASASREAWALEVFKEAIGRGRASFASRAPGDPALIAVAADWLLSDSTDGGMKNATIGLLARMEGGAGMAKLQQAFDRYRSGDDRGLRLSLCTELLRAGDMCAVEDGLDAIVETARQQTGDARAARRGVDWPARQMLDAALDRNERKLPREVLAGMERRLRSADAVEVRAMLSALAVIMLVPDDLRPALRQLSSHSDEDIAKRAQALAER